MAKGSGERASGYGATARGWSSRRDGLKVKVQVGGALGSSEAVTAEIRPNSIRLTSGGVISVSATIAQDSRL